MLHLFIGSYQSIILLAIIGIAVVGIIISVIIKRQEKRKATPVERLMFIGLTVIAVVSLFIPWADSYGGRELIFIADNSFIAFMNNLVSSLMRNHENEVQITVLLFCFYGIFLLFLLVLIAGIGGWKKFLRVCSLLAGICACLMTFLSVGIGADKLIGFYVTMLCGIALVVFSFKKGKTNAEPSNNSNDSSENNNDKDESEGEQKENAATVNEDEEPSSTNLQTAEQKKVSSTGKKKKSAIFIAIGGIVALIGFLVWAKTNSTDKEMKEDSISGSQMEMTTLTKGKVTISLAGSGTASIVWGDGTHNTYYLSEYSDDDYRNNKSKYDFTHTYHVHSMYAITIVGENITMLLCDQLDLLGLDVRKNAALEWLECSGNQLTSLDVNKNLLLTTLGCSRNQLTSLDVSKNTKLTILYCAANQLKGLDVSNNTELTDLRCWNNQITSLDVRRNTKLKYLWCSENQLTNLNVSRNTALEILDCHNNQLEKLDVSKNSELTELYCFDNQITNVDVSRNQKLKKFIPTR